MSFVIYTHWYLSLHDIKIMMFAWSRLIRGLGTNFPDKKRRKISPSSHRHPPFAELVYINEPVMSTGAKRVLL